MKSHCHHDTVSEGSNRLAIAEIMSAIAMCTHGLAALPTVPGTEVLTDQGVLGGDVI